MGRWAFGSTVYDGWKRVMTSEREIQEREVHKMSRALVRFLGASGAYLASFGRSLRTALAALTKSRMS